MLTFNEVIDKLRDGKGYRFGHNNLAGHFYKAPYPAQATHSERDSAHSAITFWYHNERAMPTLMLYDFDDDTEWYCTPSDSPID